MGFLAHGTGLVTHEAPRLTATGSPPYPAAHAEKPLRSGMVLSVETHVADPQVGFVKLEDTVIVTPDGADAVADHGRGWNAIAG
jgi:Xaa-Pro aminopeptidase